MFQETVTEEEEGVSFEPSKPLMPPPELVTPKWSDLPPLGRGIPRGNAPSRPEPYSRTASPNSMRSGQTLHEYRTSRALPNIDIPLSSSPQPPSQSSAGSSYSHNSSHSTTPPPAIRGHPSTVIKPHVDSASTSSTTPPQTLRIHSRIASHESGSSTHGTSPSAHQTTYSLDITKHSWRSPEHLPTASPISRTRSATTIIDASSPSSVLRPGPFGFKPSDSPPLPMPIKPFARSVRERSGSVDSENTTFSLGLPGLKDVLKVPSLTSEHQLGMSDLLPPSPSVAQASMHTSQFKAFRDNIPTGPALPNLSIVRSTSPVSYDEEDDDHLGESLLATPTPLLLSGPIIRPLDYAVLTTSDENTHAALARTVDDLSQWLSVVRDGLDGLLDNLNGALIEEEEPEEEAELSLSDAYAFGNELEDHPDYDDPDFSGFTLPHVQQNSYFPV
ncbi:hypothetical protein BDV98DRAFT_311103 [Pterulicium gracile]|uniref:Uncharacterized protein n=1 Tax=Pterulicium gracile TaxID=1884261 RepID=A0A5C3Q476_9AGAR|nr:hypothetical protein BDV98DRAFT_311103 [Pterula gracilis]